MAEPTKRINPNDVDWLALRIDYERTPLSVSELARKYGLARSTLRRRLDQLGWVPFAPRPAALPESPEQLSDTAVLKAKLKRIVEKKLDMIEREMDEVNGATVDGPRAERLFGTLLRSHERLELVAQKEAALAARNSGRAEPGGETSAAAEAGDADLWRQQLAERIRKLRARWGN